MSRRMRLGVCPSSSTRSGTVSQSVSVGVGHVQACQSTVDSGSARAEHAARVDRFAPRRLGGLAARSLTRPTPCATRGRRTPMSDAGVRGNDGDDEPDACRAAQPTRVDARPRDRDAAEASGAAHRPCRIAIVSTDRRDARHRPARRGRAAAGQAPGRSRRRSSARDRCSRGRERRAARRRPAEYVVARRRHRERHRRAVRRSRRPRCSPATDWAGRA